MKEEKQKNKKPKVAFVCVHNSCRSQIAECLGKLLATDVFDSYSAGTEPKSKINSDAVRIIKEMYGLDMEKTQYSKTKEMYGLDMEKTQYSKTIGEIPQPDVAIFMGCNVKCPILPSQYSENWGLDDPTGKSDEKFREVIAETEEKIKRLKDTLKNFK